MVKNQFWKKMLEFCKKNGFIFFAVFIYIFFCWYYMGPGFSDCSHSLYGFGDSTAGPIWKNSMRPEQPLFGGPETRTNYPYGESLYSPVGFAASVQTVSMSAASKLVGPVCAYNLYNIVGYITTAIVAFMFVLYITRNRWVSLLAGYAFSYTPYVQSKIGGHPNYAFGGVLLAIVWLLIHTFVYRKTWSAILLGATVALCAYLDPYFTLLAISVIAPITAILASAIIVMKIKRKKAALLSDTLRSYIKPLGISSLVFVLCMIPLIAIRIANADVIDHTVERSRGNTLASAMLCSNKPLDYLLPDPQNKYMLSLFGESYTTHNLALRHWCNYGESRVSLSLTLLIIILSVGIYVGSRIMRKRRIRRLTMPYPTALLLASIAAIALTGVVLSLPPYLHGIKMPSGYVLSVTEMWRIFAREYMVVNLALVILGSIALAWLLGSALLTKHRAVKVVFITAVFIGVFAEYQINDPFSPMTFSYQRDVPSVYLQLKNDPKATAIAEYPIDRIGIEYDSAIYYMTMQTVHQKSMMNSALAVDPKETVHLGMRDLTDPQTIPALRYLGINRVMVHGQAVNDVISRTSGQLSLLGVDEPIVYGLKIGRAHV